jgi:hypothetical protein
MGDDEWVWETKSGKLLTNADMDALAAEAEAGYDPAMIGPGVAVGEQRRWTSRVSPRDPHTVLRLDLVNQQVLIKYSDRTTDWCPKREYLAETKRLD